MKKNDGTHRKKEVKKARTVWMTDELYEKIRRSAESEGRTFSAHMDFMASKSIQ